MSGLSFSKYDQLRDVVAHTHTDLQAAGKMLCRLRWIAAWKKVRQGYARLGKALDTCDGAAQ